MKKIVLVLSLTSFLFAQTDSTTSTLVFLSDTQALMWVEKLYLNDYDNEQATQNIFSSILKEKDLTGVIHCGDVTAYGMSKSKWEAVLPFIDLLKLRSIPPFVATKGNHDYFFFSGRAMRSWEEYIPDGKKEYASYKFGTVAIVLLNSNIEEMEDSTLEQQKQWYASTLVLLNADNSIHFIITVAHHSPFTNSAMVTGSSFVRKEYLPAFYTSPKTKLFISGHAHRFEHFQKKGKDFLVIGGVGGLFHDKREENLHEDLHLGEGKFFHYLKYAVYHDSLSLDVVKVESYAKETAVVYRFAVAR